jgi:hypothetical protein
MQALSSDVLGTFARSDSCLLRHCRSDAFGMYTLDEILFRNVGGVSNPENPPTHFTVQANKHRESAREGSHREDESRVVLRRLVPPTCGQKLIAL